jgi:hypothetical protein
MRNAYDGDDAYRHSGITQRQRTSTGWSTSATNNIVNESAWRSEKCSFMNISFENKIALVTGAASELGLATAKAFAESDASVVLADWNEKAVRSAAEELTAQGHQVSCRPVFVSAFGVRHGSAPGLKELLSSGIAERRTKRLNGLFQISVTAVTTSRALPPRRAPVEVQHFHNWRR